MKNGKMKSEKLKMETFLYLSNDGEVGQFAREHTEREEGGKEQSHDANRVLIHGGKP